MKPLSLVGSALLAGLMATSALAAEAISGANVRSGPGADYRVVAQLAAGANVTVNECVAAGWCRISHAGPDGWVSARLLADNGNAADYYNAPGGRAAVAEEADRGDDDGYPILIGRASELGLGSFRFGFGGDGELVCLVTFFERADVRAGRDSDVERAQLLPMRLAQRGDGPNDNRAIYDYGTDRETTRACRALDRMN